MRNQPHLCSPSTSLLYALARGTCSRHPLPPGPLIALDRAEKKDQRFLLSHFAQHGPIFKAIAWREFWVCLEGLDRCARFLAEHREHLRPVTIRVEHLIPKGFLRQMRNPDHRTYRQALVQAIREERPEQQADALESMASEQLAQLHQARTTGALSSPEAFVNTLNRISTHMLIRLFYGLVPGDPAFDRLDQGYQHLGPHGLIWNPGARQTSAFHALARTVRASLADTTHRRGGIVHRLQCAGTLDDTLLGNVIYMVEMGRYDTHGLFRWLAYYASRHPDLVRRLAEPDIGDLARAFVLETLRLDQSERLLRRVERDVIFDGYLIPRSSTVRLCLWESHKAESSFADAFRFQPERFLHQPPSGHQFSPFGLDHHHCPLSNVVVAMGSAFLRALARNYTVSPIGADTPVRGPYHWEPPPSFDVRLVAR
jgi:cytochrome P450